MKKLWALGILSLVFSLIIVAQSCQFAFAAGSSTANPVEVQVGVWVVNVEKIDLPASSYRMDFYLWFNFDPTMISLDDVKNFEFVNGAPTKYLIEANESAGYLEYRVKGDFITNFDFTRYPFESHDLNVVLEHNSLNVEKLVYTVDSYSQIEPSANVAGWDLGSFQTDVTNHSYDETFSRFVFSVTLSRPMVSSFIKSVLPVSVITAISLLAFFMSPQNFAQRIALAVTTLLAATTFHLSLLGGIPPTGYLTFADRIMICVYIIFLFNIGSSVFIMRLVDSKKLDAADRWKRKSLFFLPVLVTVLAVVGIVF